MNTPLPQSNGMRFDLQIIASWIEPGSKVLDLGCGQGDLLYYLKKNKQVVGTGIEKNEDRVAQGISKGLSVLQGDISDEIEDYPDEVFDYVILSQTLQQVYNPNQLIRSMLRIGKKGIVSFPNFCHWGIRMQMLFSGFAPISPQLPFEWHNTPNIRVISIKDFRDFSHKVGFRIIKEAAINTQAKDRSGRIVRFLPNLRATYGTFLIAD